MTCIIGFADKSKKKVLIGGDSACSTSTLTLTSNCCKVFKNGNFIFGCTSSYRMVNLLHYKFKVPKINTTDMFKYMCTDFIDAIIKLFRDNGFTKIENNEEEGGQFLVGYKDRLFLIDTDFQVNEMSDGIATLGIGDEISLGAMYALNEVEPKERILKALEISEHCNLGVGKPFVIEETD